jgi:negative regulator of sigma E activity
MTQRDEMIQPGNEPNTDKLHDHHRQQLSAMLDGELLPDQAKFMLRRLEHDGELAACWERWQVCGDILRGRHDALLPADFSRRVANAIAGQDQAASAATAPVTSRQPRWARWGGGAALAASVAMVALFVGRQVPGPDSGPAAQTQVIASTAAEAPGAVGNPVASVSPAPTPVAPAQAPAPAPDAATTLATAVAVAEVPRRAAERRAARSQQQRAASRVRRAASAVEAPVRVAAVGGAPAMAPPVPTTLAELDAPVSAAPVTDLFATRPAQARPWPRAILPGFPADGAFTASYGGTVQEHPFHPFEPRVELQPAPEQPTASGPR